MTTAEVVPTIVVSFCAALAGIPIWATLVELYRARADARRDRMRFTVSEYLASDAPPTAKQIVAAAAADVLDLHGAVTAVVEQQEAQASVPFALGHALLGHAVLPHEPVSPQHHAWSTGMMLHSSGGLPPHGSWATTGEDDASGDQLAFLVEADRAPARNLRSKGPDVVKPGPRRVTVGELPEDR